jgi:ComF family protein
MARGRFSPSNRSMLAQNDGMLRGLIDTLLPARCVLCREFLSGEVGVCTGCLERTGQAQCDGNLIHLGEYRGRLERAARALKFADARAVAIPFGAKLADGIRAAGWRVDALVPVPLHGLRQLERGYNQSEILAQGISKALNAPVLEALGRTRSTKRQARLEKTDRIDNIRNAFEVRKDVTGLELILVDDVHTTGSTLNEASLELIRAGAKRVRIAVIART